ncbi:MAG: putative porin [Candidatus Hydrogenedentes bacterium]|nr:putative porin [Candidatus Hydrogenedentota bacterium]
MSRWLWAVIGSLGCAAAAFAQDPPPDSGELKGEIERLRKVVLDEQQVIADCMKRIDQLETSKTAVEKNGFDKVKVSGDLRYRFEYIHQDPSTLFPGYRIPNLIPVKTPDTRDRQRLRLRLNFNWKISDEWNAVAQLASGENYDPISTNQSLTGGFSKKPIAIDLLYFDYHPVALTGLNVYGGKMKNPFYTPGKTQTIWDQDLTPEGLAFTYTNRAIDNWELSLNGGYFQIQENSTDYDSQLLGVQGIAKYSFTEDGLTSALLGLSYYDYIHAKGFRTFYTNTDNFGNSLNPIMLSAAADAMGFYAQDYNLAEAFAEVTFPVGRLPLTIYGDYVVNTARADRYFDQSRGDTAWALGLSLGKCVAPKSWALKYEYRDVQRDAVVGAFTDSDFSGGGANARGHILGAEYAATSSVRLALTYFINDNRGSDWIRLLPVWGGRENVDGPYQRLQADLNIKF